MATPKTSPRSPGESPLDLQVSYRLGAPLCTSRENSTIRRASVAGGHRGGNSLRSAGPHPRSQRSSPTWTAAASRCCSTRSTGSKARGGSGWSRDAASGPAHGDHRPDRSRRLTLPARPGGGGCRSEAAVTAPLRREPLARGLRRPLRDRAACGGCGHVRGRIGTTTTGRSELLRMCLLTEPSTSSLMPACRLRAATMRAASRDSSRNTGPG